MDTKKGEEKKDDIIIIKKTRDALIVREGDVMRKYVLDREWQPKKKKERKAKEGKKCDEKKVNQVVQPKCVAQANELPKCSVRVEKLTPRGIQKIIQKEKNQTQQQKLQEISCEY